MQGFGARALRPDQKPKYLNSPEGELYRKSRTLYGIDLARPAIAKAGRAVVVEGYTDVLAAHQAGIEETVAVMGTAITPEQVQLLAAHAEEVVLALDADRAGREAMLRAQRVATGKRVRLRVAAMPAGEDPADMLSGATRRRVRRPRTGSGSAGRGGRRCRCSTCARSSTTPTWRLAGGARPGARRGGAGAGGDAGLDHPRGAGAGGGRPAGRGPGARGAAGRGRRAGRGRPGGAGGDAPTAPTASGAERSARGSGASGRCSRCARRPRPSDGSILERLTPEHLSSPVDGAGAGLAPRPPGRADRMRCRARTRSCPRM